MAIGKEPDRRKFRRVSIFQEILLGSKKNRKMDDISEEGMFISTPEVFMKGSILDLEFRLFNEGKPVAVKAEVRFIQEGVGMGVRFINLQPEDRERIRQFVGKF